MELEGLDVCESYTKHDIGLVVLETMSYHEIQLVKIMLQ